MSNEVFPPLPQRTLELRAKGWEHRCTDLQWHPSKHTQGAERALCRECGSVHHRWERD